MRKLLKFLHTVGAIGLAGALFVQLLMLANMPPVDTLPAYAAARGLMGVVAQWMLFPSLAMVLVSGLLSMAWTNAFHGAGWVWMKLALGISVFEGTLIAIQGPAVLGLTAASEFKATLVILAVAVINVVLAVWRPKFGRTSKQAST